MAARRVSSPVYSGDVRDVVTDGGPGVPGPLAHAGTGPARRNRTPWPRFPLWGLLLGLLCAFKPALASIPWPELDRFIARPVSRAVLAADGRLLGVGRLEEGLEREWVDLADLPPAVVAIFLAAEDRRFYLHGGVDLRAILRSALQNARAGKTVAGASTVSMQLARLIVPHGQGLSGKVSEALRALCLEARLSKKRILELWLNNLPFGSNLEGLASASRRRFGHRPESLAVEEALLLAQVPRSPARYDPGIPSNRERVLESAQILATRAAVHVDQATLVAAVERAVAHRTRPPARGIAPHFVRAVLARLPEGSSPVTSESLSLKVATGGPDRGPVETALSPPLQERALELLGMAVTEHLDRRIETGAVLVLDNRSGEVLAWVGSHDFGDEAASGQLDGVLVRNQCGSTLKPFLYALALERGYSPAAILPDIPTVFGSRDAYIPMNFNRRFNGPVRLRVALASSLNVPAVWLLERLGVAAFEDWLVSLGLFSVVASRGTHGLPLALGAVDISLAELVRAFALFPRGGRPLPVCLPLPKAPDGAENPTTPLISPQNAWLICDILSDQGSRYTGFGARDLPPDAPPVMIKTGTANQFRHIWALGASEGYTVGVWMGSFHGTTVIGETGSSVPAGIVRALLMDLSRNQKSAGASWPRPPAPLEAVALCALSGQRAGPDCPHRVREYLLPADIPPSCTWHRGGQVLLPDEFRVWAMDRRRQASSSGETREGARIRRPLSGSVFYATRSPDSPASAPSAEIRLETVGFAPAARVIVNGSLCGTLDSSGRIFIKTGCGRVELCVEDARGQRDCIWYEVLAGAGS